MDYQPITKEKAAEIMSVSTRTIENWMSDGTLPAPYSIGRRVYWHPDTFYRWLDQRLGVSANVPLKKADAQTEKKRGCPRKSSRVSV